MATVEITIAGRRHELTCRDGEEAHLREIAGMVDAKATDAARAMGGMSEARQMLYAALMLADELNDGRAAMAQAAATVAAPAGPDPRVAAMIDHLAERIEAIGAALDQAASAGLETPAANA